MRDGVRVLNVARGPGSSTRRRWRTRWTRGRLPARRSTCFRPSRTTEHPLFGYPNVVATPHLGASTAEATDRAGYQAAEQVVAALNGGTVTSAVTCPRSPRRTWRSSVRSYRCARGRSAASRPRWRRACRSSASRWSCLGRIGDRDARPLSTAVPARVLRGHTEEDLNAVNVHRSPRPAAFNSSSRAARARVTSPISSASPSPLPASAYASSALRSAAGIARTCSRRGASASTCSWSRT